MALCEAGKRVAKDGSSIYREPAMSLFGILKGVLGIPHYAGIEGCRQEAEAGKRQRQARGRGRQEAEAGKAQAQFTLGGFYERGQFGLPQDYTE
jgi:TPR repeat protein